MPKITQQMVAKKNPVPSTESSFQNIMSKRLVAVYKKQ